MRRLAGRFLLEHQLRVTSSADVWLALDEKLNRSVAVYLMATGAGTTADVLSAARLAAGVPDTRFVQVLDAVDDGSSAYVVTEWLVDAVDLATRLAAGPMPSWEAVALASEVAEAMASAHAFGLTHQRLDPHNVLRTESGLVKIHGLRLEAALSGLVPASEEDARTADVRGIGALLYASLTAHWPHGEGYRLVPAPQDALGPVTPATLRPEIPPDVDSVVMRLLSAGVPLPEAAPPPAPAPSDGEQETLGVPRLPLASCDEAVEALSGLRRTRPQQPPPQYQTAPIDRGHGQQPRRAYEPQYRYGPEPGPRGGQTAPRFDDTGIVRHGPGMSSGREPGPRKGLAAAVGVLALAGVGLLGWQFMPDGAKPPPGPQPTTSATKSVTPKPLTVQDASLWQSSVGPPEHADTVANTITGKGVAWTTFGYTDGPKLALKPGTGIIYDLGSVSTVDHVTVDIGTPGATLELRAAEPDMTVAPNPVPKAPPGFKPVDRQADVTSTTVTLTATPAVRTRFVLVWFTALPRQDDGKYRDTIEHVQVFGSR